jgi:hypothetical protein
MSLGLWPRFKPSVDAARFSQPDGAVLLLDIYQQLDRLASVRRLRPLSSFGDRREVPDGFDGGPDELEDVLGPWDEWFAISDGIQTVEGLIDLLRSNTKAVRKVKNTEGVLTELEELLRCLRIAEKEKAEFRLEIVE